MDVPTVPAEVARPLSFGFRALAADLMLLQSIQIHGARNRPQPAEEGAADDRAMARLLTYATDLDPAFAGAYRFAGNALIRHTLDGKAVNVFVTEGLLRKGVRERPDDWRIAFLLGFTDSFYLGRKADAARAFREAARVPGAPRWIGLLATRLAADVGELALARELAEAMLAQASDESIRAEWKARLLDLDMERDLRNIEAAVARHRQRQGTAPRSVQALVESGDLPAVPREPHGGRYELLPDGEPRSTAAARLRLRREGSRSGMEVR